VGVRVAETDGTVHKTSAKANTGQKHNIRPRRIKSVEIAQEHDTQAGSKHMIIRSFELYSRTGKHASGVFQYLFTEHRNRIKEFVRVTGREFDVTHVRSASKATGVCTWQKPRQWVPAALLDHRLFITGYRLGRVSDYLLRSWHKLSASWRGKMDND
jgi:hypothetical protein